MKASELLKAALANYKNDSYMCHELDKFQKEGTTETLNSLVLLDNKIQSLLYPHRTIVLHNLLMSTSNKYNAYYFRYGFDSDACYKMRVAFWQDMIVELESQGL